MLILKAYNGCFSEDKTSLSDDYVHTNLLALIDWQDRFTTSSTRLKSILDMWEENLEINLAQQMTEHQIRLTYPVFIAYQQKQSDEFHASIKSVLNILILSLKD